MQGPVDSLLKDWNKTDIDSIGFISVTNDSAYVFPITNYQSSLLETRTAGDNSLVSEVTRQGDYKFLYRLRVDEVRVFYDVTEPSVEVLAIVSKKEAQAWLDEEATPSSSSGSGPGKG